MGYWEHKYLLSFALDAITEHGLPVDRKLQEDLRIDLEREEKIIHAKVQDMVPVELIPIHPKQGYKSYPKDLRALVKAAGVYEKGRGPLTYLEYAETLGYHAQLFELENDVVEMRLCKRLEFNPNSRDQLIAYIRHQGYRVPLHIDTGAPTTGKEELQQLIDETDDEVLKLAQQAKKVSKLKGTYTSGAWVPGSDSRVHGTFRFGTASQQTSCTGPNIQQFLEHYNPDDLWTADISKRLKACIRAEPGYKLVKVDARGAHARMQGWLAEDEDYYRLASLDVHSYNTAHYVDHPLKDQLLLMEDSDLKVELKKIKKQYEHDRNFKLKRIAYLMQFGGGAEKAFRILHGGFHSVVEVQDMMNMISSLFPKTFRKFPKYVRKLLAQSPRIISPFGCCRWFWDGDMEEATAFLPSNCFHCHVQSALVRLHEQGAFAQYGACNFAHDSLWLHCREDLVESGIAAVKLELERPSTILVNSLGPFWCAADAQVGDSLDKMEDV